MSQIERRILNNVVDFRDSDGKPGTIGGHAALFGVEAVIAGMFRERILPGAFEVAIKEDDVRALFNHDPNYVLGRNRAGTLTLTQDEMGLRYAANAPDTQWARDLAVSVKRGDVNQSSFGFMVPEGGDTWERSTERGGLPLRTIRTARLQDVSVVTYPAYEETTAEARSQAEAIATAAATLATATADEALAQATAAMLIRQKRQDIIEGTL